MNRNDFDYTINFLDMVDEWGEEEIRIIEEEIANGSAYEGEDKELELVKNLTDEDKIVIAKRVMDDMLLKNDSINEEINDNIHYYIYHNTQQDEMLKTFVGLLKESE